MNSTPPPPLRRMVPSTAPRVGFLATASSPKPPWIQLPPPRPPEVNRRILNASEYPSASSSRSLSVPRSRKSTRAALIVAVPMPRDVCVADQTSYEKTEDVSLHTCLNKPATRHLRPPVPSVEPHQPTADVPLAAPQHQLISNARPALEPYLPQHDQPLVNLSNDFDDFSTLTPFGSHDEYSLYNDFLPSSTNILPTVPTTDPFIESAAVPSSEEDILANVDVGDFEKEVDIGQWMKYLQDDSDTLEIPGLEENIFERVEQEPTTPELINESFRDDYFAVPNLPTSSGFGQQMSTQTELDPVQEFFPGMCVDVSNAPATAYDNGMATCPEWQTYQQYSPSHTPASIVSDVSSTTSWSTSSRTTSRKRPYPAPSVATTICDDDYRAKRDKNNRASQISRQKHKEKVESQKTEVFQLASKNEALKLEVETLEQQIATMRAVLMDSIGQAQK